MDRSGGAAVSYRCAVHRIILRFFLPGLLGLPARGERFFALRTLRSSADFGTARSRFMTVLKCRNSGCASNSSAVSGGGISSPAPVSCDSIGPSTIRDTFLYLASQLLVGNTATNDLFHNSTKPFRVRQGAVVIPETLFVKIPEQMEWLNTDVGPVESALQQTPEVLHRICVDVSIHILHRVIDNRVLVFRFQPIVGFQIG